ncbi:MAG: hypothetical protein HKN20_02575, partial [Gemmatimonadetes bacterium]|nr:hypothetical protein [Gemmatimonadota bacterium]
TDFQDDIKYRRLLDRRGIYSMIGKLPVTIMGMRKVMAAMPWMHGAHERLFGFPAPRFFVTDAPLEETEAWLEPIRASIDSIDTFTREELGARFAVFVFPRSYQYSDREVPNNWEAGDYETLGPYALEPFRYFERVKGEAGYGVYSLLAPFETTDVFPTCFPHDPHWNPDGNRIAARAIFDTLSAHGLLAPR